MSYGYPRIVGDNDYFDQDDFLITSSDDQINGSISRDKLTGLTSILINSREHGQTQIHGSDGDYNIY